MPISTQTSEGVAHFAPRPQISHVVFDFDGTLSWLRHGWPELMAGLFLKHTPAQSRQADEPASGAPAALDAESGLPVETPALPRAFGVHELLLSDILSLNGKSSIYQMEKCSQRVLECGGPKLEPAKVLLDYQHALAATIKERTEKMKRGEAGRDEFLVYGARELLEKLHARGLVLIILSGTVEPQVKQEAELLDVSRFFGAHIYGGTSNLAQSSKKSVIARLLHEEQISGERLLSFGDGPVEIQLTKDVGGLAVGVASDEDRNGSGQIHPQKAAQLREAGADLLIADYRDPDNLLARLLGPS